MNFDDSKKTMSTGSSSNHTNQTNKMKEVYRVIDRKTNEPVGAYSRACHDQFDFDSPEEAVESNVHGIFKDTEKYKVAKYKVTYELLEDDVLSTNVKKVSTRVVRLDRWHGIEKEATDLRLEVGGKSPIVLRVYEGMPKDHLLASLRGVCNFLTDDK